METTINTGDIVKVTRDDGKQYESFVVKNYPEKGVFYGRVLESASGKLPSGIATGTWNRYGLVNCGICQVIDECKSIEVLSKGSSEIVEDASDTKIYTNSHAGKLIRFCMSEGFGGWSDSFEFSDALVESYSGALNAKTLYENEEE